MHTRAAPCRTHPQSCSSCGIVCPRRHTDAVGPSVGRIGCRSCIRCMVVSRRLWQCGLELTEDSNPGVIVAGMPSMSHLLAKAKTTSERPRMPKRQPHRLSIVPHSGLPACLQKPMGSQLSQEQRLYFSTGKFPKKRHVSCHSWGGQKTASLVVLFGNVARDIVVQQGP